MRRFLSLALSIGALLIAVSGGQASISIERPTVFRVAVTSGSESQKLLAALNQEFTREHTDLRFALMPVADPRAAAKAMEAAPPISPWCAPMRICRRMLPRRSSSNTPSWSSSRRPAPT